MADTYYQTATTVGVVDDPANVPPGATILTQAQYDAAIATWQTSVDNAAAADQASAEARYNRVYLALRSMGMPVVASQDLAKTASGGIVPAADPETNVKAMTLQTAGNNPDFTHTIAAASGTWEKITEVPDITIQESGLYKIGWRVRGETTLPSGFGNSASTTVGVFKAAVIIAGTETLLEAAVTGSSPATSIPALGVHSSGSGETFQSLNAGDVLSFYAKKTTGVASVHRIKSDTEGRTYLGVERVRPA